MKFLGFAIVLALLGTAYSVKISKCDLVKIMTNNGIPRTQMPDWVCLVDFESKFDTNALNTKNSDGSWDYGIFQINNGFFCSDAYKGANDCKIPCSNLRDADITDDIKCAKLIYKRHGFNAWKAWEKFCRGKKLPSIAEC